MSVKQVDMNGKICIVTGANSGIGYETALALATMEAHVVMICRSEERGKEAQQEIQEASKNEHVDLITADLSHKAGIHSAAEQFKAKHDQLNVLVNNAGAVFTKRQESADGIEMTMALNHLGYFGLTYLLFDLLKATPHARVVSVSSEAHRVGPFDFDDIESKQKYSAFTVYGQSKLANILFTKELDRIIQEHGANMTANCLHPGVVATNFGKGNNFLMTMLLTLMKPFTKSQNDGAATSIYLATSPEVATTSGEYFDNCKVKKSTDSSQDMSVAYRLWEWSEEKLGLSGLH